MKKIRNTFHMVLLLLATLLATNSCSDVFNNPMQDKETGEDLTLLLLDMNFFDTKVTFFFVDSLGNEITDKLHVNISGDDADKIVDLNGNKITDFETESGFLQLAVDPNFTPSDENPVLINIFVWNEQLTWKAPPIDMTITTVGIVDELIALYYSSDEGAEFSETGLLKSAQVVQEPFTLSIATNPIKTLKKKSDYKVYGKYQYYNSYDVRNEPFSLPEAEPFKLQINAYDLIDNTGEIKDFGFSLRGYYRKSNNSYSSKGGEYLGSDGASSEIFDDIVMASVWSKHLRDVSECSKGITVKFDGIDVANASAKFKYTLTYSDQSTKTGILTLAERTNPDTKESEGYYGVINNIYVPNASSPKVNLEIEGDAQYNVQYSSAIDDPCGSTLNVTVTPKSDTYSYDLNVVLKCESGAVGAAPSLLATYWKEGDTQNKTTVNFSGGSVNLRLAKNQNYNISGTYLGESRTFGFSTNPNNAQSFGDAIADADNALESVTIDVTDPSDTKNGTINVTVSYNSNDCPF